MRNLSSLNQPGRGFYPLFTPEAPSACAGGSSFYGASPAEFTALSKSLRRRRFSALGRGDGHARDAPQSPRADTEAAAAAADDPARGELEPGLASARTWSERLVMWSHAEHGGQQHRLVFRPAIAWHQDTLFRGSPCVRRIPRWL